VGEIQFVETVDIKIHVVTTNHVTQNTQHITFEKLSLVTCYMFHAK